MQVVDVNGNMFGYDHLEIIGADGRPKNIDKGLTSVGLSMPSAFTVSNSPLTSNGTIGVTGAGTTSQYIDGTGALRAFPGLTGFVPYVGATQNVDLGEFEIKAGQFTLDVSPTGTATVGTTRWNNTIGSSETTLKGGNVILKNGVDLVARVVNKVTPNTTLTKANYPAVRVSGAQGQRLAVAYAQANNDNNSADTIGLVVETIATNQEGFIMTVGQLNDVNTTGSLQGETWADGDVLYLSPTTPGALTNVKPTGLTGHIVVMGYVEYAHAVHGSIYVKIMNGWELDELHNVYINNPLNNQGLFYNASDQLWKNKSIDSALGYTPVPDSRRLTINGTAYDLTADRTWSVGTVTSVTASSPLSSSGGTTPNITISQATGSTNGYLSSADWTTFNNKQPAGNYITSLSGEATGSGPGTASVTLNNASVTAKVLTGVNITGGSISASDSILTAFGKLQNQINGLIGSSVYQGTWNASTNTPALASGVGTRGYYYIVNVAGSTNLDGITDWNVGDWAIFDGTAWQQVDNTDSVTSVNGQTGAVSLTTDNIPEGATNLYFTQLRARQSITLTTSGSSGASTYNNSTGALNIPNYTLSGLGGVPSSRRLEINGISYDLSADRSWSVGTVTSIATSGPLTGGTITGSGTIGITQATPFTDGYLSYFDWNTFNNKQDAITLTTTGTSGAATLIGSTLNIPQYQSVITNPVTGTGTTNYVARWTSSSNISTGVLYDNGTNVGIGTTAPYTRLDVTESTAYISVSSSMPIESTTDGQAIAGINFRKHYSLAIGASIRQLQAGGTASYGQAHLAFYTNDVSVGWNDPIERMRITANGNVGIATTNPLNTLQVGSVGSTGYNGNNIAWGDGTRAGAIYINSNGSYLYASGDQILAPGSGEKVRITSGGNVGVGTSNPTQRLSVIGNVYANGGFIGYRNDGGIGLEVNGGDLGPGSFIAKFNDYNNTSKVVINGVGDVGIGTTTLTKYMSSAETLMSIVNSNVASLYLYSTTGHLYNMSSISNGDLFWYDVSAGTERMRLTGSGNFGIGTSSPNVKFEVAGQAFVDKFQYNQAIQISGADLNGVTTAGFYAGSGLTNAPDNNGWYWVTVERHSDSGWVHQLATSYGAGNTENLMYSRVKMNNSTWTAWKKISYSTDTPTATSVYDLLPNARVDYTWVGQVIDGTWVDIFTRANNVLTSGTWMVNMYVSDYATGGEHYQYTYSGTFTWYQSGTNQNGTPAASEIALHRMGHAANNTVLYLRTTEEAAADGGDGKFQITGNYSHFANTTINFKFVKII